MTTPKHLRAAAVLMATSAGLSAQFVSAPGTPIATGLGPISVAVGDFNGDGSADLAVANSSDNTVTVLLGNGKGGFAAAGSPVSVGAGPTSVAAWNSSGLAVANALDNTVSVLEGNGSGSIFTAVAGSPFEVGSRPAFVAAADFNGDGVTDLAIANSGDNTVTVLLGVATGGFGAAAGSPFSVGSKPVSIAVADFNGDYVPDLAIVNAGDNTVTVLLGNGTGGFTAAADNPFAVGSAPVSVAAGDFNKDGMNDLAIANSDDNTVTVLVGTGMGGFTAAAGSPYAVGKAPSSVVAADFNADNIPDLAIANSGDNTVTVLLGAGAGRFAAASYSPLPAGTKPESVAVADFNGDGKPDMAIANSGDNTVTVLLNNYLSGVPTPQMLSAASGTAPVSAGSIVAIYGGNFANGVTSAMLPLPSELGGVSANFKIVNILGQPLSGGAMPLFYVSPRQINAQVPADVFFPPCNEGSGSVYSTSIQITTPLGGQTAMVSVTPAPAPGLFTANETGSGVAAAQFVTNLPNGTQTTMDVAKCSEGIGTCAAVPLNVTEGSSALVLWGTGISEYSSFPRGLTVMAGNQPLQVAYAGASPQYAGLDQINVLLPASFAGSGTVNLSVTLSGTTLGLGVNCPFSVTSNVVTIDIE
jgi:uncharacterized protein (TIGR03437 family)